MSHMILDRREHSRDIGKAYLDAVLKTLWPPEEGTSWSQWLDYLGERISLLRESARELVRQGHLAEMIGRLNTALAQRGWFVPPCLFPNQVRELHRAAVVNEDLSGTVEKLVAYCDQDLIDKIVEGASTHKIFAERAALLRQALEAHKQARFALSIPVFLAQAEGAYLAMLEQNGISYPENLFSRKEWSDIDELIVGLPATEVVLAETLRGFSTAMCGQFAACVRSSQELDRLRAQYPEGFLSRHAVLHGRDANYATKENSMRASFILDAVREVIDLVSH